MAAAGDVWDLGGGFNNSVSVVAFCTWPGFSCCIVHLALINGVFNSMHGRMMGGCDCGWTRYPTVLGSGYFWEGVAAAGRVPPLAHAGTAVSEVVLLT